MICFWPETVQLSSLPSWNQNTFWTTEKQTWGVQTISRTCGNVNSRKASKIFDHDSDGNIYCEISSEKQ